MVVPGAAKCQLDIVPNNARVRPGVPDAAGGAARGPLRARREAPDPARAGRRPRRDHELAARGAQAPGADGARRRPPRRRDARARLARARRPRRDRPPRCSARARWTPACSATCSRRAADAARARPAGRAAPRRRRRPRAWSSWRRRSPRRPTTRPRPGDRLRLLHRAWPRPRGNVVFVLILNAIRDALLRARRARAGDGADHASWRRSTRDAGAPRSSAATPTRPPRPRCALAERQQRRGCEEALGR